MTKQQGARSTRGKTVGRALILSFLHDYEHRDEAGYKPLYTQAQFNAMVAGLRSEVEHRVYTQYVSMYGGLTEEFARAHGYYQQALNVLGRLTGYLSDVLRAMEAGRVLGKVPGAGLDGGPFVRDEETGESPGGAVLSLFVGMEKIRKAPAMQEEIRGMRENLLMPSLRWLLAYNTLVEHMAGAYDLPGLSGLQMYEAGIEAEVTRYNEGTRYLPEEETLGRALFPEVPLLEMEPRVRASVLSQAGNVSAFERTTLQRLVTTLAEAIT